MDPSPSFEARFARVEGQLTQVVTAVGDLAANQAATNANVNALTQAVRDQDARSNRGVNWGWLISGVLLLGGVIALYVDPVRTQARETAALQIEDRIRTAVSARDLEWIKSSIFQNHP